MTDRDNLLDFATRIATRAGEITLTHFGRADVEFKGDGSEVTVADREAEDFIRAAIGDAFPEDGIVGEERGEDHARSGGRRWIVDPIDGTRSFGSGVPLYGVLLALEVDGSPMLGCCHFPVLGQTLAAITGGGAWLNGTRATVSECDDLSEARVVTSGLEYWRDWATEQGTQGWNTLVARSRFARTWGDCFGYALLASGRADVLADPAAGAYWDYAPMVPIVQEAGGCYTTLAGAPVQPWSTALATNGRLHAAALGCWPDGSTDGALQTAALRHRRET
jgi:histidinol phosphatase-like enzyme (inositol monophosphatase family)